MTIPENSKFIPLTQGKFAIVDNDDCGYWLSQFKWSLHSGGYAFNCMYIKGSGRKNQKSILTFMHRAIMFPDKGMQVDHINGNRLDNRRCNLRVCTNQQNNFNKIKRNGSSKYKGVYWNKSANKWHAMIKINQKGKFLGHFDSEEDAALAYNYAAEKNFKEYANLNSI